VGAFLVVGIGLRLFLALDAHELRDDERYRYLEIAHHLRNGEGYAIAGRPTAQVMPLWPLLLASLPSGVKPHLLAALLSAACLPLAWRLGRRLRGPRTALSALALLALDLDSARLGGSVLTEPLLTLLLLLFALFLTGGRNRWAAVALGLGVLTRPEIVVLPLLFAAWTRSWRRPAILLAGVLLALAPWAARNAFRFDRFIPLTTTGGITWRSGMNAGEEKLPFRKKGQGRGIRFEHARVLAREGREADYDREQARAALVYARNRPLCALELTAAKAALLWTPLQRKGTSAVYALAVLACWFALLLRKVRFATPLVGPLLLTMTLMGLVFLALPRYRAPYHPYVFLLAAVAVVREEHPPGTGN
jgi:hypothetical protein